MGLSNWDALKRMRLDAVLVVLSEIHLNTYRPPSIFRNERHRIAIKTEADRAISTWATGLFD